MDDAYHFLSEHNIVAHHRTVQYPPSLDKHGSVVEGYETSTGQLKLQTPYAKKPSIPKLLVLAAADMDTLSQMINLYKEHITNTPNVDLESLLYTLDSRRSLFQWRSYLAIEGNQSIADSLINVSLPTRVVSKPKTAFVFTGQGAQWARMGLELLAYPIFRNSLEELGACLHGLGCEWSLIGM